MNKRDQNLTNESVTGRLFPFSFFLFPLIHLAVALPLAYHFNIWSDEASTLYSTQDGVIAGLNNSINEKQAPLYFVLLSIWRLFDDSFLFARIFSIFCSTLSIGAFFILVKRLWNEKTALFATFFFSVHPYLFWASTEIRVYALVILLSLLVLVLFERNFLSEPTERGWKSYALIPVAAIALYANYYLGFLLVGLFVALIILKRFEEVPRYFVQMVFAGLLFLPMVWLILTTISTGIDGTVFDKSMVEGLRMVWNHILYFALPTELFPPEEQTVFSFLRVWAVRALLLAAIAGLAVRKVLPEEKLRVFAVVSLVISGFLLVAYYVFGMLYVEIRHAAVLFGPFVILLTALISELAPTTKWRTSYFAVIGVVLIVFYSYALTAIHTGWTKRGDWTRVAAYVQENEKPGQPIVVFRNYEALAFSQSYSGPNKIFPDEKFFYWKYEGEIGTAKMWPKQIEYVISVIPTDTEYIWLATEDVCQTTEACGNLENFVKENYTVVRQKYFYKERVRLLKKR